MLVYFAGPLFSQAELDFNARLTAKLENLGFTVFLPQRDGIEKNTSPYNDMTVEEWYQAIFKLDRDKILEVDIFSLCSGLPGA